MMSNDDSPHWLHDEQWRGLVSLENHNFLDVLLTLEMPSPSASSKFLGILKFLGYTQNILGSM